MFLRDTFLFLILSLEQSRFGKESWLNILHHAMMSTELMPQTFAFSLPSHWKDGWGYFYAHSLANKIYFQGELILLLFDQQLQPQVYMC